MNLFWIYSGIEMEPADHVQAPQAQLVKEFHVNPRVCQPRYITGAAQDPDDVLASWVMGHTPSGILHEVPEGISPWTGVQGSYTSVTENEGEVEAEFVKQHEKGFFRLSTSKEALSKSAGS